MSICKPYACILPVLAAAMQLIPSVWAQTSSSEDLSDLRPKAELTADDLARVDQFLNNLISRVERQPNEPKEEKKFRDKLLSAYNHSANNVRFKQQFAERCNALFLDKLQSDAGSLERVLVSTMELMSDPATIPALKEAGTSTDAATRVLVMTSIYGMRPKIAGDPAMVSDVLRWLDSAAAGETNATVVGQIYRTIDFVGQLDEQASTLVNIFEARIKRYEDKNVHSEEADVEGYRRLLATANALPDVEKRRLVGVLAKYLVYYCHRFIYTDLSSAGRGTIHRLVYMVERLLGQITGQTPAEGLDVKTAVGSSADDNHEKILSALLWWVGTKDAAGKLNAAPWQVAIGGGPDVDFAAPVPKYSANPQPGSSTPP